MIIERFRRDYYLFTRPDPPPWTKSSTSHSGETAKNPQGWNASGNDAATANARAS